MTVFAGILPWSWLVNLRALEVEFVAAASNDSLGHNATVLGLSLATFFNINQTIDPDPQPSSPGLPSAADSEKVVSPHFRHKARFCQVMI